MAPGQRVSGPTICMFTIYSCGWHIWHFTSMPTMHSKHSLPNKHLLYTWLSLHLKLFTRHGSLVLDVQNMNDSLTPLKLLVWRLISTMGRRQTHQHTLWQWVWDCILYWSAADITVSLKSKTENDVFQEALVIGTPERGCEMCRGSCM